MKNDEYLILVDENDKAWGKLEKQLVHELGLLHRAFSIFIFNSSGQLLLQQRAAAKYHSGGLWTNTCCSHPRFGEELNNAVERRLMEEMGMECEMQPAFSFIYNAALDKGLTEHEYDHVFVGISDEVPVPDHEEVMNWRYADPVLLELELMQHPERFTEWFKLCFGRVMEHCRQHVIAKEGALYV